MVHGSVRDSLVPEMSLAICKWALTGISTDIADLRQYGYDLKYGYT